MLFVVYGSWLKEELTSCHSNRMSLFRNINMLRVVSCTFAIVK